MPLVKPSPATCNLKDALKNTSNTRENLGRAWALLAERLRDSPDEPTTEINGEVFDALACYGLALDLLGSGAKAPVWADVADLLDAAAAGADRESDSGAEDDSRDADGSESDNSAGPREVAVVKVGGNEFTALACRARCVELEPKVAEHWILLGQALSTTPDRSDRRGISDAARAIETQALQRVQQLADSMAKKKPAAAAVPSVATPLVNSPLNALACFIQALNLNVALSDAWFFVADELIAAENNAADGAAPPSADIAGKQFAIWQCLVEGLKRDPKGYAPPWIELAKHMPPNKQSVTVGNSAGEFTRMQCVMQSLAIDDDQAPAWLTLGLLLQSGTQGASAIDYEKKRYRPRDCFARSLAIDSSNAEAWVALAAELRKQQQLEKPGSKPATSDEASATGAPTATVTICDVEVTALRAYAAALQLAPENPAAWHGLSIELDVLNDATEIVLGGVTVEVTALDCIRKAVELDPADGASWHDLARIMATGSAVQIGEWQRSQIDCFAEACALEPNDFECWIDLADALPAGGVVKVGERVVSRLRSYAEAVRCNPESAEGWSNLGALLAPGTTVSVADQLQHLTQIDCYTRSLRLQRTRRPDVWRNMASALRHAGSLQKEEGGSETVTVDIFGDGQAYDADRCDAEAAQMENAEEV
jgi:tetratricopeptide (TPR) repeat protein